jgi:hypothetical protein
MSDSYYELVDSDAVGSNSGRQNWCAARGRRPSGTQRQYPPCR